MKQRDLHNALLLFGAYTLTAWAAIVLARQPGNIAMLWYANALAVAFFMAHAPKRWPWLLLVVAAANVTANRCVGDSWLLSVSFVPANLLEVLLSASLLHWTQWHRDFFDRPSHMLRMLAVGGVLPQLVAASLGAAIVSAHGFAPYFHVWAAWFAGSSIGAIAILPLALKIQQRGHGHVLRTLGLWSTLSVMVGVLVVIAITMRYLAFPFIYAVVPLVLASVGLRFAATAFLVFLAAIEIGCFLSLGYIHLAMGSSPWKILLLYLPVWLTLLPPLVLAASVNATRQRESALAESEARWKFALEGAGHGVWDWNLQSGQVYRSPCLLEMLGEDEHSYADVPEAWVERIHPADRERVMSHFQAHFADQQHEYAVEVRMRCRDGRYVWIMDRGRVIERGPQREPWRMIGTFTNIDARKKASLQLEQQQRLLDQASCLTHSGAWERLPGGQMYWSQPLHDLLAWSGPTPSSWFALMDWLEPADQMRLRQAMEQAEQKQQAWDLVLPVQHPDGRHLWLRHWGQVDTDAETAGRWWGVVQDLTEQKQLERLKSQFVSTVSHELRTPLTALRGALDLLMHSTVPLEPPVQAQLLQVASRNSTRLVDLVNMILDYEKIQAGKLTLLLQYLDFSALLRETVLNLQPYAQTYRVHMYIAPPSPPCWLPADKQRLEQVLANLLSNAIKFSPEGAVVTLSFACTEQNLTCRVHNHGDPIPEDFQAQMFTPFLQADASTCRQRGGTGLGLSITRSLIQAMGGRIGFHSQAGQGTTFWFSLPLTVTAEDSSLPSPAV